MSEFRCVVCGKARREIELRLDYAGAYRCKDNCWAAASAEADPEPGGVFTAAIITDEQAEHLRSCSAIHQCVECVQLAHEWLDVTRSWALSEADASHAATHASAGADPERIASRIRHCKTDEQREFYLTHDFPRDLDRLRADLHARLWQRFLADDGLFRPGWASDATRENVNIALEEAIFGKGPMSHIRDPRPTERISNGAAASAGADPAGESVIDAIRMARDSVQRAIDKAYEGEPVERDLWDAHATLSVLLEDAGGDGK